MSEVSSVIFMRMCFVIFICFKVAQLVWRDARACFLMPVGIHCYSMLGSIALGIFVPAVTSITVASFCILISVSRVRADRHKQYGHTISSLMLLYIRDSCIETYFGNYNFLKHNMINKCVLL